MGLLKFTIPPNSTLKVSLNDTVTPSQELLVSQAGEQTVYNVAEYFSVPVLKTKELLKKSPGEVFHKDDILASKKSGFSTKNLTATFQGQVLGFNEASGMLVVTAITGTAQSLVAPVKGVITNLTQTEIDLTFQGEILYAKEGVGKAQQGILLSLLKKGSNEEQALQEVAMGEITEDMRGKIILGGYFTRSAISKALSLGVVGVIAGEVEKNDLAYFETNQLFQATIVVLAKLDLLQFITFDGKQVVIEGNEKRILILL